MSHPDEFGGSVPPCPPCSEPLCRCLQTASQALPLATHSANVSSLGDRPSSAVIMAFFKPPSTVTPPPGFQPPRVLPKRQLFAFDKTGVPSSSSTRVCFTVSDADLALVDDQGNRIQYAGTYRIILSDGTSEVGKPPVA